MLTTNNQNEMLTKLKKNNEYEALLIDVPKFLNEMKLDVYRSGKLMYQSNADKLLISLQTKIFNPKTKYSMNAINFSMT